MGLIVRGGRPPDARVDAGGPEGPGDRRHPRRLAVEAPQGVHFDLYALVPAHKHTKVAGRESLQRCTSESLTSVHIVGKNTSFPEKEYACMYVFVFGPGKVAKPCQARWSVIVVTI